MKPTFAQTGFLALSGNINSACRQVHCSVRQVIELVVLMQAEGGFVYALGMLLQEDVTYNAKGKPEFDTTWNYKIPSAACIPRDIIIRMLQVCAIMLLRCMVLSCPSDVLAGQPGQPLCQVGCARCAWQSRCDAVTVASSQFLFVDQKCDCTRFTSGAVIASNMCPMETYIACILMCRTLQTRWGSCRPNLLESLRCLHQSQF